MKGYATGSLDAALMVAASGQALRRARRALNHDVYARTTLKTRRHKKATIKKILKKAGHNYLPAGTRSITDLCACLVAARYRSVPAYLGIWKRDHIQAGHPWSEQHELLRRDYLRAAARGIGPPRKAEAYKAENLHKVHPGPHDPVVKGGPHMPGHFVATSTCWLLRGLEAADLLCEQASVDPVAREATLDLAATKMDPQGRGAVRTLRCNCAAEVPGPCPYCTLAEVKRIGSEMGLGPKDPLFPTRDRMAARAKAAIATIRLVTGLARATEHSCRRAGAQWLARLGLLLYLIQFLGRWGGPTVAGYVGEALQGQLAIKSAAYAANPLGQGPGCQGSWPAMKRELMRLARKAAKEAAARPEGAGAKPTASETGLADYAATHIPLPSSAAPGVPCLPERRVRGLDGKREVGEIHSVALCDPCVPANAWTTACGWRFAASEHSMLGQGDVSCGRCLASLVKRARTRTQGTDSVS